MKTSTREQSNNGETLAMMMMMKLMNSNQKLKKKHTVVMRPATIPMGCSYVVGADAVVMILAAVAEELTVMGDMAVQQR